MGRVVRASMNAVADLQIWRSHTNVPLPPSLPKHTRARVVAYTLLVEIK
jgi:hypothetical protein